MHAQLEEAAKRLQIAKDVYIHAVDGVAALVRRLVTVEPALVDEAQALLNSAEDVPDLVGRYAPLKALEQPQSVLLNQAGEVVTGDQEVPDPAPTTENDPSDASGTSSPQE